MATKKENKKVTKKVTDEEEIEVVEVKKSSKEPERRNIFVYFLMMLGIFAMIDFAMMFISTDLSQIAAYYRFGDDIILEIFYAILVLIVMLLFKNAYVFTNKQEKLYRALLMGAPLILFSTILLVTNVTNVSMKAPQALNATDIFSVLILCALIGITEEFLCRGWLQNEFLERYGDTKKNILTSIILASFVFGIMHIVNVITTSQTLFETVLQIINAVSIGFFFGVLYYKTRNIWSVIILHAYYDFSIMIGKLAEIKECTYGVATTKILVTSSFSMLMLSAFWIICALLILRRCNYPDEKADLAPRKLRDFYLIVLPLLAFTFIFSIIPYESIIDDYKDYYICYNYNEKELNDNYTLHYPVFEKYIINYKSQRSSYLIEGESINEVVELGNYSYSLFLKDGMAVLRNVNTASEVRLHSDFTYKLGVVENEDGYFISIVTLDKNGNENVYISDFMKKEEFSNTDEYLHMVVQSFRKLDLPEIDNVGYITIEGEKNNYPAYSTADHDLFIIIDKDLYLIKK